MNTGTLISSLVDGLLIGVVYGIAAMGLNFIWGVMRVINLAHGALIALGMFGVYLIFSNLGINPYLALILVAVLGLLAGFLLYFISIARVINAPHLSTLLATFSVNMIIIGLGTAAFTTSPPRYRIFIGKRRHRSSFLAGYASNRSSGNPYYNQRSIYIFISNTSRQVYPCGSQ